MILEKMLVIKRFVFLTLFGFLASCQPENAATDFKVNISAISGPDANFNTKEHEPVTIKYSLIPNEQSITPWIRISKYPSHGELKDCFQDMQHSITCEYVPVDDFFGRDVIKLKSGDGGITSNEEIAIFIDVENVPDVPVALPGTLQMAGNEKKFFTLNAKDVDSKASDLSFSVISVTPSIAQSRLSCIDRNCEYTSLVSENGQVFVKFKVVDESGLSSEETFTITVSPLKAPVAINDSLSIKGAEKKTFMLRATDADSKASSLIYSIISVSPSTAQNRISCTNNSCSYTSLAAEGGQVEVKFKVTDEVGLSSNEGTFTINVQALNAPLAMNDSISMKGGEVKSFSLSATDIDSSSLSYSIVSVIPSSAQARLTCNGRNCSYKSMLTENGQVALQFKVTDEAGLSSIGTFSINVAALNAPVALNENHSMKAGELKTFNLNATDADSTILSYMVVSVNPTTALNRLTCTGKSCFYNSALTDSGQISILFKVTDEVGLSSEGTINIHITALRPPVAQSGSLSMKSNETRSFVLSATDADSTNLSYSIVSVTPSTSLNRLKCTDKNCSYSSGVAEGGQVVVTFKVTDEANLSSQANFTIDVTALKSPVATNGSISMKGYETKSFTLSATDDDSTNLTYSIVSVNPSSAQTRLNCSGKNCSYTATNTESGQVVVTFKVTDETNLSSQATFTINITALKAPVAVNGSLAMKGLESRRFILSATDADSTNLTYTIVSVNPSTAQSRLSCSGNNCTYNSLNTESGNVIVTFKVTDETELFSMATFTISITPLMAPVAQNGSIDMMNGETKSFVLGATDSDSAALSLSFSLVSVSPSSASGRLTCNGKNCSYTSLTSEAGIVTIRFKVTDETNLSSEANFTVNVNSTVRSAVYNFIQPASGTARGVDILWVVDNSTSMGTYQSKLAQSFDSFINNFLAETTSFSYKMGVTTTDAYVQPTSAGADSNYGSLMKNTAGNIYDLSSTRAKSDKTGFKNDFIRAVTVGISGDGHEKALSSARVVVTNPVYSSWFDSNNHLVVIIVSDELEQSIFPVDEATYISPKTTVDQLMDISKWGASLRSLKTAPSTFMLYSIANPPVDNFQDDFLTYVTPYCLFIKSYVLANYQQEDCARVYKGRYKSLSEEFKTPLYDINSNFNDILRNISQDVVRIVKSYNLDLAHNIIEASIVVKVDGALKTKGVDYNYLNNSIEFINIPAPGAKINVTYNYTL